MSGAPQVSCRATAQRYCVPRLRAFTPRKRKRQRPDTRLQAQPADSEPPGQRSFARSVILVERALFERHSRVTSRHSRVSCARAHRNAHPLPFCTSLRSLSCPPPLPTAPPRRAAHMQSRHRVKEVPFLGRKVPLILQGAGGPSALVAIGARTPCSPTNCPPTARAAPGARRSADGRSRGGPGGCGARQAACVGYEAVPLTPLLVQPMCCSCATACRFARAPR